MLCQWAWAGTILCPGVVDWNHVLAPHDLMHQVPEGATPRTMAIQFRGAICRSCKPGDEVELAGIFLPEPYTGFRAMRAGLLTSTYLEVR